MRSGGCWLSWPEPITSWHCVAPQPCFEDPSGLPREVVVAPAAFVASWILLSDDRLSMKSFVIFVLGLQYGNELYGLCSCYCRLLLAKIDCNKWLEFPLEGNLFLFELPYLVCINYSGQGRSLPGPCLSCKSRACSGGWIAPPMNPPPSPNPF